MCLNIGCMRFNFICSFFVHSHLNGLWEPRIECTEAGRSKYTLTHAYGTQTLLIDWARFLLHRLHNRTFVIATNIYIYMNFRENNEYKEEKKNSSSAKIERKRNGGKVIRAKVIVLFSNNCALDYDWKCFLLFFFFLVVRLWWVSVEV